MELILQFTASCLIAIIQDNIVNWDKIALKHKAAKIKDGPS